MQLSPEIKKEIEERVASGAYANTEEVLQKALEALREDEDYIAEVCARVQVGLDQLDRGESISAEEVFALMRARIADHKKGLEKVQVLL